MCVLLGLLGSRSQWEKCNPVLSCQQEFSLMMQFISIAHSSWNSFSFQVLMQGHAEGELWGLSVHPTSLDFVTASEDKTVRSWSLANKVSHLHNVHMLCWKPRPDSHCSCLACNYSHANSQWLTMSSLCWIKWINIIWSLTIAASLISNNWHRLIPDDWCQSYPWPHPHSKLWGGDHTPSRAWVCMWWVHVQICSLWPQSPAMLTTSAHPI